jgi:signal transduction histidine kinase
MYADPHDAGREVGSALDFADALRECLACGIITVDHRETVTSFSPRAEALTGVKAVAALGHSIDQLPIPLRDALKETLSTGKAVADRRIELAHPGHGATPVLVNTTTVTGGRDARGAVAVLNSLSAAGTLEAQIRRLDRLHSVATLSAGLAHEAKNAFVAVKTFVDLLLEQNKQADLAEIVRQEMGRIDSILSQMRKFSGPARPAFSSVQLHAVLDKSLQVLHHLLEEKQIRVTRSFNAAPDVLSGDQNQLEQAFINLIFNARDAMSLNGHLAVSTERLAAGSVTMPLPESLSGRPLLRVTIRDDGIGIPPRDMARLFEPFFTTKPDGTGLGLAITRRIIQDHHGLITTASEPGKGSAFTLLLPAADSRG